jgi:DNA (cytosine-5)-methyltransferase 1
MFALHSLAVGGTLLVNVAIFHRMAIIQSCTEAPSRLGFNHMPRHIIAVDLFAGAGGLSLGFQQAGFDVRAAVEYDPIHCATHEFNFPKCATICRDVTDIDGDYIRSQSSIGGADITVVIGGAPCQGFSLMGYRALDDPRNRLASHFVRLVKELQPKYFVFENVKGLTVGHHKAFLHELIAEFKRIGYSIVEPYRVLNALWYGVPQDRQRLFIMGAREGQTLPSYPAPTHQPDREIHDIRKLPLTPTVWDAIGDLPEVEEYDELSGRDWVEAKFGRPSEYAKTLSLVNGTRTLKLTSSLRTVHTPKSQKRFQKTPHGCVEEVSRFLKLDPNGYCNTLRAGTASDRGAFTSPRPIHPHTPRCITVREAARLHSYPDWFRFHTTKWHGFRQIGNSVPPLLARAVALQVAAALPRTLRPAPNNEIPHLGDPTLLSMSMSDAAEHFKVASDVVPRRKRAAEAAYA